MFCCIKGLLGLPVDAHDCALTPEELRWDEDNAHDQKAYISFDKKK